MRAVSCGSAREGCSREVAPVTTYAAYRARESLRAMTDEERREAAARYIAGRYGPGPASPLRTVMPGLPVAIEGACLLPFDHELRLSYKRCGWSSRSLGSVRAMPAELMSDRSVKPGRQSAVKQEPWSVRTGIPVL